MKHFISNGIAYRSNTFTRTKLTATDRYYLRKTTTYKDNIWQFFSQIEEDFRLLNIPYVAVQ